MNQTDRFTVYKHSFVYNNNQLVTRQFIVLKHEDGTMTFTDFHKYVVNPYGKIKKANANENNRFKFACKFLNYAFFVAGISSLSELTVDIGRDFLSAYGKHMLEGDDEYTHRNQATVKRCTYVILDFYKNLIADKNSDVKMTQDDVYTYRTRRDKHGKAFKERVPQFEVTYIPSIKEPIFRDMPGEAFRLLFNHIAENHKDILGLVMLQAFAGLRPSEACNVRRTDSPLGPGIIFKEADGDLHDVYIDLREELNLRSDFIPVGQIKKERMAQVPHMFLSAFKETYEIYMKYTDGKPYEAAYGAFSVNKQGKAITYNSYYQKFRDIIRNEMIEIYLNSNDPELSLYANTLMNHSLSPHVFRHWYTAQLVLSGIAEPGILMHFRGDSSPESALTYISAKSDLERQYSKVSNESFEFNLWAAKKAKTEKTKDERV